MRLPLSAVSPLLFVVLLVGALGLAAAPPVQAQTTFSVNSTGNTGDGTPGNGECNTESTNTPECTLRAALEEAEALGGNTTFINYPINITFAGLSTPSSGKITISPEGDPLVINSPVTRIRGDLVGANTLSGSDWQKGDPPIVFLDGSDFGGSIGDHGISAEARADSSGVIALGIINMPGNGIRVRGNISPSSSSTKGDVVGEFQIQFCWIGVDQDGQAAGNGTGATISQALAGIRLVNAQRTTIGDASLIPAISSASRLDRLVYQDGGRNVISGNVQSASGPPPQSGSGIIITNRSGTPQSSETTLGNIFFSQKTAIAGNYIGLTPDGSGRLGNAGYGIYVDDLERTRGSTGPTVRDLRDPGTGVQVYGNAIAGNGDVPDKTGGGIYAITTEMEVRGNVFGVSDDGGTVTVLNDPAWETAGITLLDPVSDRTGAGNVVGNELDSIECPAIGTNPANANLFGGYDVGVEIGTGTRTGSAQQICGNYIGATPGGQLLELGTAGVRAVNGDSAFVRSNVISGADDGVVFDGASIGFVGSGYADDFDTTTKQKNRITGNRDAGVRVLAAASKRNTIRGNEIYGNGSVPIDLGDDGATPNDDAPTDLDDDDGPNELMNTPLLVSTECTPGALTDNLTIEYRVEAAKQSVGTSFGLPNYGSSGLRIDVYAADVATTGGAGGLTLLEPQSGLEFYDFDGATFENRTMSFSGVDLCSQFGFATATDANGNTSEFSNPSTALPVELAAFTARVNGAGVELAWATAQETGNAGFAVEHRAPDAGWTRLGFVAGAGTTAETQRYRFSVADLAVGVHAFRLRQQDVDGTEALSREITAEVRLGGTYTLSLGPNPMQGAGRLTLALRETQAVQIELYDLLGRRVQTLHDGPVDRGTRTFRVDASRLGSGPYVVRVRGEQFTTTRRLTVVR